MTSKARLTIDAVAYLADVERHTLAGPKPCTLVSEVDGSGMPRITTAEPLVFDTKQSGRLSVMMYGTDGRLLCEWKFNAERGGQVQIG